MRHTAQHGLLGAWAMAWCNQRRALCGLLLVVFVEDALLWCASNRTLKGGCSTFGHKPRKIKVDQLPDAQSEVTTDPILEMTAPVPPGIAKGNFSLGHGQNSSRCACPAMLISCWQHWAIWRGLTFVLLQSKVHQRRNAIQSAVHLDTGLWTQNKGLLERFICE